MGQAGSSGAQQAVEERYYLQKVTLGKGSFATVFRAVDRENGEVVAMKRLDKATLPRRGVRRGDIECEIAMMKAARHENLTRLFDTFEDQNYIYLALEYCDGGDFGDKVKERGMEIPESEAAEWMRQMCAAINALHTKSICHRDIKPENFMVASSSSSQTLKLSDFGLAVHLPPGGKVLTEKCGSPAFMAPEQNQHNMRARGYGLAVDIWAAGVSMYMVFFGGRHPFITDRGQLDEKMLMSGTLDFRVNPAAQRFLGFDIGIGELRYSNEARQLCQRMVEVDDTRRIRSEDALRSHWLRLANVANLGPGVPRTQPPPGATVAPGGAYWPSSGGGSYPPPSWQPQGHAAPVADERCNGVAYPVARQMSSPMWSAPPTMPVGGSPFPQPRPLATNGGGNVYGAYGSVYQRPSTSPALNGGGKANGYQQSQAYAATSYQQRALSVERPAPTRAVSKSWFSTSGMLPRGQKCRYESGSYGWMTSTVVRLNGEDGTYDLAHRQHAAPDKISPCMPVAAADAWKPGTAAAYHSSSANKWVPAVVVSFNEADNTYNLDVREHAPCDRIRARVVKTH